MPRISVLIACHNRRALTLQCLRALAQATPPDVYLDVFVTDDASTDGTRAAIRVEFPAVRVLEGDGSLYWNRGMLRAWQRACEEPQDFFLWLNDDLAIAPDAIRHLLASYGVAAAAHGPKVIVTGHTLDPRSGAATYGGLVRSSAVSSLRFRRAGPDDALCDTMNGNCVLVPAAAARDVGLLCERYTHAFGDIDYGLRARATGYRIVQTAQPVGRQAYNEDYPRRGERTRSWRFVLHHPKGIPWREWLHFCRRHGGWLWPVNFVLRYVRLVG